MQCTLIQAGFYQLALFCVHLTQHRYSTGQTAYRFFAHSVLKKYKLDNFIFKNYVHWTDSLSYI